MHLPKFFLCPKAILLTVYLLVLSASFLPAQQATNAPLRIIAFGAHPDDNELKASGVAAMWAAQGHKVKFVAMTNGDIGHFSEDTIYKKVREK